MEVRAPNGDTWHVSRQWFEVPRWARRELDWDVPADVPWVEPLGDDFFIVGLVAAIVVTVLLVIVVSLLVPLLVLIVGILVALAVLVARLASITAFLVAARRPGVTYAWRVRGLLRSHGAMKMVVAALERGAEPVVPGVERRLLHTR